MLIKGVIDEDFVNYKKPSMVVLFPNCTFKCEKECGKRVCQNSALAQAPNIGIESNLEFLTERYMNNPITKALCFSGLDPIDDFKNMLNMGIIFRMLCDDDIVIYTGYTEEELSEMNDDSGTYLEQIKHFLSPCVVKYGRYIPDQPSHFDEVLGVNLASNNQYAVRYEDAN